MHNARAVRQLIKSGDLRGQFFWQVKNTNFLFTRRFYKSLTVL
jgi:hypothetical protein